MIDLRSSYKWWQTLPNIAEYNRNLAEHCRSSNENILSEKLKLNQSLLKITEYTSHYMAVLPTDSLWDSIDVILISSHRCCICPSLPCAAHYSKKPRPLRNRIIPSGATTRIQEPWPHGSWVPLLAELWIVWFLTEHGFLFLSQDPREWGSLDVGKSCNF